MVEWVILTSETLRQYGTGHCWISQDELLNSKKRGQFPDEFVKIEDTQTKSLCNLPDVLSIVRIKEVSLGGLLLFIMKR
jgi:hypothetical protein